MHAAHLPVLISIFFFYLRYIYITQCPKDKYFKRRFSFLATMSRKMKLSLAVLLVTLLVLCAGLAQATKDPELKQCKQRCKEQRQLDEQQRERCIKNCEKYSREKKEREREAGERGEEKQEEESGGSSRDEWSITVDPEEKKLRQCQKQCERQGGEQRALCRWQCQERQKREHGREQEEEEEQEQEEKNPYVFHHDEDFTPRVETEHGRIEVLQRFTKKSKLLPGLEKYGVVFLEANPQTFIAPSHFDADFVLFVATGRGTITLIREDKKQSFNIECGDVLKIPAGTLVYLVNKDENEKLFVVKFFSSVNLPGKYEAFHGPGGENPESFYKAFSWELLEAALKVERRRLERIFKQDQGGVVKATKEQIHALSQGEEEEGGGGIWPFPPAKSSGRPFNIIHKGPIRGNNYGQLFEANPDDYKGLKDLDLTVSFANISQGCMSGPYYNSKSIRVSIVLRGEGWFEMACPRISSSRGKRGTTYQKISSRLRRGTIFVVLAGHPVATVASKNKNLQILCFEINAKGNIRYPLAGKGNVISLMDKAAKGLGFGVPVRELQAIFDAQDEEWFFEGPRRQQGRADA